MTFYELANNRMIQEVILAILKTIVNPTMDPLKLELIIKFHQNRHTHMVKHVLAMEHMVS